MTTVVKLQQAGPSLPVTQTFLLLCLMKASYDHSPATAADTSAESNTLTVSASENAHQRAAESGMPFSDDLLLTHLCLLVSNVRNMLHSTI